jgi:hypothetical protein
MYLYRLTLNTSIGYDMYDSAVVIASSEEEARTIHPNGDNRWDEEEDSWNPNSSYSGPCLSWGRPDQVTVELIGTASSGEIGDVVVSSFNAG